MWPVNRGSKTTLTGSTRSESAVEGSNIRPRRSKHTSSAGLAGLQLRDALYTEHTAQVRVKGVESSQLHSQMMNAGLNIVSCGSVTEHHIKEHVDKKYDTYSSLPFGCEAELQEAGTAQPLSSFRQNEHSFCSIL